VPYTAGRRARHPQVYAAGRHTGITRGTVPGRGPVPVRERRRTKGQLACWRLGQPGGVM